MTVAVGTGSEETKEGMRQTSIQVNSTFRWRTAERELATKNLARNETEDGTWAKLTSTTAACRIESKSLILLRVNCRSIYKKTLDFWNLVDTYNVVVVIGTVSWLREEICIAGVFRADFTTFRRDRHACGGGVFICVKNYMACAEL